MNESLIAWLASVASDPLAYVMGAFPWGEKGTRLENYSGPEPWQRDLLERLRLGLLTFDSAIQEATASGHGVGKSACVSWLIKWAIDTRPHAIGVVTANTETQLKTKTWVELGRWHSISITRNIFKQTATAYYHPDHERTWRLDMVPWSERNTEAFAGLHNQGNRIILIFDEASAIPDLIWETAEGALTDADTQIIWCVFGNPTRNSGRFKTCFDSSGLGTYWSTTQVDSRTVSFTNKQQITRWITAYGDDSDFVRIRVKGQFPRQGEMEFFSSSDIDAAMSRELDEVPSAPLALGVDVARFGANFSVIYPRKGRDARSIPRQRYQGLSTVDLATRVFDCSQSLRADGIFVDGGGVGGGVVDNLRHMHLHCFDVQFGGKPTNPGIDTGSCGERYANQRASLHGSLRAWIRTGALPNEADLRKQLLSITYTLNPRDEIVLTSKEVMMREGKDSPDDVDALCTTFAYPLAAHAGAGGEWPRKQEVESDYNPYSTERMVA